MSKLTGKSPSLLNSARLLMTYQNLRSLITAYTHELIIHSCAEHGKVFLRAEKVVMATLVWPKPRILIESNGGVLSVNDAVAKELEKEERPLVAVCIAGPYRTGKSYLMNRLAGRQSGFALGSTLESKTKGIWAWLVNHPLDSDKALLLLDTEGLEDAVNGNETYDMWICCLSVLLSSVFVYNATGRIENSTLERLRFVTEMSSHIRTRSQEDEVDDDFDEFFPSFILAVRDFFLKPEIDGRPVTSDEYMEYILLYLKKNPHATRQEKERLEIKMKLRSYFKHRKCFFFPSPVDRDDQLQIVDTLPERELKPTFLDQVSLFCNHIYSEAPVKKIDYTHSVNGRMFSQLTHQYIAAIRSGAVPCIESAVDIIARNENNRALEGGVRFYCTEMRKLLTFPVFPEHLAETHQSCYKQAVEIFLGTAFLDKGQEYHNLLQERLQEEYVRIVQDDAAASWEKCQRILADLFARNIDAQSRTGGYLRPGGYAKYVSDLDNLKEAYCQTPNKGVKSEEAMQFVLDQRNNEQLAIMVSDQALTEAQKQVEDERIKREEMSKRIQLQQQQMEEMKRHQDNLTESQKEHTKKLQQTFEKKMKDRDEATETLIELRLEEKERLLSERFQREAEKQQMLIDKLANQKPNLWDALVGTLTPILSFIPNLFKGGDKKADKANQLDISKEERQPQRDNHSSKVLQDTLNAKLNEQLTLFDGGFNSRDKVMSDKRQQHSAFEGKSRGVSTTSKSTPQFSLEATRLEQAGNGSVKKILSQGNGLTHGDCSVATGMAGGFSSSGSASGALTIGNGLANGIQSINSGVDYGGPYLGRGLGSGVQHIARGLGSGVQTIGSRVGNGVQSIGGGLGNGVQSFSSGFGTGVQSIGGGLGNGVQSFSSGLGTGVQSIGGGLGNGVQSFSSGLGTGVQNIGGGLGNGVQSIGSGFVSGVQNVGCGLGNTVKCVSDGVGVGIYNMGSGLASGVQSIGNGLLGGTGQSMGYGLANGVNSVGTGLAIGVQSIGSGLGNGVLNMGTELGNGVQSVGLGLANGVKSIGEGVGSGVQSISGVSSGLESDGHGLGSGFESVGSGLGAGIQTIGSGVGNGLQSIGNGMASGIHSVGSGLGGTVKCVGGGLGDGVCSIGSGMASGIQSIGNGLLEGTAESVGSGIVTGVSCMGSGLVSGVQSVGGGLGSGVVNIVEGVGGGVVNIVEGVGGGVVSVGKGLGSGVHSVGLGLADGIQNIGSGLGSGVKSIGKAFGFKRSAKK